MPTALLTNQLRTWRVAHDLSLEEVAGLTGVSISMLSRVERGLKNFAPMTRVVVARRLGVPVSELFPVDPVPDADVDAPAAVA